MKLNPRQIQNISFSDHTPNLICAKNADVRKIKSN